MKAVTVLCLAAVLALVLACRASEPAPPWVNPNTGPPSPSPSPSPGQAGHTVEITSLGFAPSAITVKAGDTVTWANTGTGTHWPASARHPAHTDYPEPGGCIGSKFDACRPLSSPETWSFTFHQKGSWAYHDHLNPGSTGKVVVE